MDKEELWKDVAGFEGYYQVSNCNRVKSLGRYVTGNYGTYFRPERIMKINRWGKDGYYNVCFCVDAVESTHPVHILVAIAFVPNPHKLPLVNHKDNDRINNDPGNLEWVNYRENVGHGPIDS